MNMVAQTPSRGLSEMNMPGEGLHVDPRRVYADFSAGRIVDFTSTLPGQVGLSTQP